MISHQAQQSINHLFTKSAKATLALSQSDICHVELLPGKPDGDLLEKHVVVFTISSFLFRIIILFHIDNESTTQEYFLNGKDSEPFLDVFSEAGNLCVGKLNHELLRYFPHLGMSTPYVLTGGCIPYLSKLKQGHQSHHSITINSSVCLHATIYVCGYAPLDFAIDKNAVEESTGELELF